MKRLLDLDNRTEIDVIDWEFIHDMQGILPQLITPELILLSADFLHKIPPKWQGIKEKLALHAEPGRIIHCAISDIENLGSEFKVRGVLQDKSGKALAFHRVVVFDKDRFEDDFIGAVISDADGFFSLAFGKKAFSDFGMEAEPDIYLRIFCWKEGAFYELIKLTPALHEKVSTPDKHIIYDFGVIAI